MARALAISVLVLITLVFAIFTGALFSESALKAIVRYAEPYVPVSLGDVSGRLYDGVEVDRFAYETDTLLVEAQSVVLAPRWACALRSVVCLEAVSAETVLVSLSTAEGASDSADEFEALPDLPEVRIDAFEIAALELRSLEQAEQFAGVEGTDLALGASGISIEGLTCTHDVAEVSAFGELRPDTRWSLVADARLSGEMPELFPGQILPSRFQAEASGDFATASATLRSMEGMALSSTVSLEAQDESFAIVATIDGLQGAGDHYLASVGYRLEQPLSLELSSADDGVLLSVDQRIRDGARQGTIELRVSERAENLSLSELRVTFDSQQWMSAEGELGDRTALNPYLRLQFENFPVPASIDSPAKDLSGSLGLALALGGPLEWQASDIDLEVEAAVRGEAEAEAEGEVEVAEEKESATWAVIGNLLGSEDDLLPVGAIAVDGPLGKFIYERVAGAAEPAVLTLGEPVEIGGIEVTSGIVSVTTGVEDKLELVIDGDLQTSLRARVKRQNDGVAFTVEPFDLQLAEETIRMEEPLIGSWASESGTVELAPFCLQARTSSLCSDQMQLGTTGNAAFTLLLDEQWGDEVAGHSYALDAVGSGALVTRWSDGAWDGAELQLDFSELRLDPFEENGAQGTIEFQQASLAADFDGDMLTAALDARSTGAGNVALKLSRSSSGLSGALMAQDFNLRALDDILPELGLETGLLTADLEVAAIDQDPVVTGQLTIAGLSASIPSALTRVDDGELTLSATGAGFTVEGDAAFGGGTLSLEGVCCNEDTLTAQLIGTRNRVELQEGLNAVVSSDIDLTVGMERVKVDGDLVVHSGTLAPVIPDEEGIALSRDIVRVDDDSERDRRFDLSVALAARVEPGFTLRTKEVEATLSGDLRYAASNGEPPALYGDLQVLGGELRVYGQNLRLSNGTVGFVGDPLNPSVRLAAEREIRGEDLRVGFRVSGKLEEPVLQLYSEPQRSERETLSYLLRGRGPDAGAALDATALALSLGTTAVNQTGVLRSLDSIPGVSGVTLGAENWDDDMAATLSAYVGERLYLSYGVGIYEPVNALTARLYLQSRLWLEVVSRLENSIDLYYRFDRN